MAELIEKVAWIRLENGRVLTARTHDRPAFYLPGGKPEAGESREAALVREIEEELGVTLDPATIAHAVTVEAAADGKAAGTVVRMVCFTAEGSGTPVPGAEIGEVAWLGHGDRDRVSAATALVLDELVSAGLLPKA
ncbi:NUDIX domain-containing protein [Streptomyces olivoreticuli]|uniref:NUDIX domain-containing protein n=1 Tax=Streptomyces blastmyceticus TaxID=68180 RepID=A0ABP3HCB6_9ACTN|nr:NUDIX domain-containing protein [Streptomyces olivoreticuli]WKK24847.1 NUDIX domain-containing protein [Streptomyces olivoreticuli]